MKEKSRWKKLLAVIFCMCLFFISSRECVYAEHENKLFLVASCNDSDEILQAGTGIVVYEGDECFLTTNIGIIDSNAEYYMMVNIVSEETYKLRGISTQNLEKNLVRFTLGSDLPPRIDCVGSEAPVVNQVVNALYYPKDGGAASFRIKLTEAEQDGNYTNLDGCIVDDSGNEVSAPSDIMNIYPIALISEQGNLVGFLQESGNILSYISVTADEFYGTDESKNESDSGLDHESDIESDHEPDHESESKADHEQNLGYDKADANAGKGRELIVHKEDGFTGGIFLFIVVGVVLAVAAVCFGRSVMRKKSGKAQKPVQTMSEHPEHCDSDGYTPTMPYMQSASQAGEPSIRCIEGVMTGRCYSVGNGGLSIGRSTTCDICFPEDAKGISRNHCRLFMNSGQLMIMDCGSTYGTLLTGYGKLMPQQPVPVKKGDLFYVGSNQNGFTVQ